MIIGLVIGSFIGAYSYRYPRNIAVSRGRSFCPKCKRPIAWYDNIPLLSYLILSGRCRACRKKISPRYPLIEAATALMIVFIFHNQSLIISNFSWLSHLPFILTTLYLILNTAILITVFVIDLEHQLIPDEPLFIGFFLTFTLLLLAPSEVGFYSHFLSACLSALFLLAIHLATRGRGMGLGDVKLALLCGLILGAGGSLIWLFLSFVLGALLGVILLITGKSRLGDKIPFGPFLVAGFLLTLLFKAPLQAMIFPF